MIKKENGLGRVLFSLYLYLLNLTHLTICKEIKHTITTQRTPDTETSSQAPPDDVNTNFRLNNLYGPGVM